MDIPARELALMVLKAVDEDGAYANLTLDYYLEKYQPGKLDRAFATEVVYGTLRSLNTLDWVLARFLQKPLSVQSAWIRNILRLSVYQLLYMNKVPDSAACNEGVNLARKYGHQGVVKFVNAVLRNVARERDKIKLPDFSIDPVGHISLKYSHPSWMVSRWLDEFGVEATIALCVANNSPAFNTIRTNTLKITRAELADILRKDDLVVQETKFAPEGLILNKFLSLRNIPSFKEGLFQVQDESSILAGHALSPQPSSRVLDTCSAPGGKTTHLAQLMNGKGEIVAVDIHSHKLSLVLENCNRLGIDNIRVITADARELPHDFTTWADYVLVDAPCSGLGVLRRRPDSRWRKDAGKIAVLQKLQQEILESAAHYVRPGGVLVYCTCTITHEENLGQVEAFLSAHKEFALEDLRSFLSEELDWEGTLAKGFIQLLPHVHNMDGLFIARMLKRRFLL